MTQNERKTDASAKLPVNGNRLNTQIPGASFATYENPGVSYAQAQFLRRLRREKRIITLCRILILVLFLFLWELSARLGWIDSFIFCSPSLILQTLKKLWVQEGLLSHITVTVTETLASFLLVVVFGTLIAVLLWLSQRLSQILEPYLVILNSLPKSALAPLLIVWLGANERTIIVAGMSVAIFGSIITLSTGFRETDPEKRKLVRTLGGTRLAELTKIVLPSSVPLILSTMKVNIGLCLVGVIIGEFIGARKGLGYLIIYGTQTFKLSWVLASILLLCMLAVLLYGLLSLLERLYHQKR